MGASLPRPAALAARLETPIEEWPYLDGAVLQKCRSRRVCMTCHWFRHHAGVNGIPLLTCRFHQGLITHGEHVSSRSQGWTDDMTRQVLHFKPLLYDRWSQSLEVTFGEVMSCGEPPRLLGTAFRAAEEAQGAHPRAGDQALGPEAAAGLAAL
jgi:hypothetical protein